MEGRGSRSRNQLGRGRGRSHKDIVPGRRTIACLTINSEEAAAKLRAILLDAECNFDAIKDFTSYQKVSIMMSIIAMRAVK